MSWLEKILPKVSTNKDAKKNIPEGVWHKCPKCQSVVYSAELERNLYVCTQCEYHHRINARTRLDIFLDEENEETGATRTELDTSIAPVDRLKFKDLKKYKDRLSQAQKATGENDALLVMHGSVEGVPVVAAAFDFKFMGGSMGSVVGEKLVRAINYCIANNLPLVCFAASGGARMQEALFSLMQMAKTSAALTKLGKARLPFISVLTDPTMGGVSASFAMLGDIHIAEPNALIGFAGQKVIEQTVREELPEGFQRSEFLLEKGAIDMIVARKDLREKVANLLSLLHKQ